MSRRGRERRAIHYFEKAHRLRAKGDLKGAEKHFRRSIRAYPTAEAYISLAGICSSQQRYDEAIEACQKAILVDPELGNPYNDIGSCKIAQARYDEAIPWLLRAIGARRYDTQHFPYFNLGRVYYHKQMYSKAIEYFEKSLEIDPGYRLAEEAIEELRRKVN
ncbi:MAG TPA: tetratricopeptide repeat protein [Acidobacteriota bacterium]|nr:tetratricopeptide repeat protein [Acidobacteriota bacterium]